jgi:hypothetical protein
VFWPFFGSSTISHDIGCEPGTLIRIPRIQFYQCRSSSLISLPIAAILCSLVLNVLLVSVPCNHLSFFPDPCPLFAILFGRWVLLPKLVLPFSSLPRRRTHSRPMNNLNLFYFMM